MTTNPYFTQGTTNEQDLLQDLVDEQIKMFGKNVYYLPRKLVKEDKLLLRIHYPNSNMLMK